MKFMQIEPQPARGKLDEAMWDDPNYIAEEKYDGDRRIAQFCGKVVRFTGRRISVKDGLYVEKTANVPHLSGIEKVPGFSLKNQTYLPPAKLEGTVLDGEMVFSPSVPGDGRYEERGGMSKYVTSIMGSLPEEAVKKQIERGWLRYVVFDCLWFKGKDLRGMRMFDRVVAAQRAVADWANPFVALADGVTGNKRQFYRQIVERGGEGIILKRLDHKYGDKQGWVKVKRQATADVVIMGFIPAKYMSKKKGDDKATLTKYAKAGLIGAIQCGQYVYDPTECCRVLQEVATVSGMDDLLRSDFTVAPGSFIGKVIEIEHNGREPTGRFRHPRFNRFRPDKAAKACTFNMEES